MITDAASPALFASTGADHRSKFLVSDPLVDYVRGLAEPLVTTGRGTRFADEVEPSAGVGALDRLAAYAGRVPLA